MAIVFAALSALSYGAADFLGGVGTRKSRVYAVLFWSQLTGLLTACIVAPLAGSSGVLPVDLLWGAAAGLSGAVGIMFLYTALARTVAAVSSPIAAVVGAILPVFVGLSLGERPEPIAWIGVVLALPAIVLLSREGVGPKATKKVAKAVRLGILSGIGFGAFFVCISRTSGDSGFWPLVAARAASICAAALVTLVTKRSLRLQRTSRGPVVAAGFLDMLANVFYLTASRVGLLILVTVVTALYPAPTVVLARIVHHEHLGPERIVGLVLAIAGIALIGLG